MALPVRPAGCPSVRGHLQFSGLVFAIFAAVKLKRGVLLCSQELLFSSYFGVIDSFLPLELSRISDFFQFSALLFAIFAAIGL
jgi:hypothetical protein